jgi:hypothetical protein
MENIYLISSDMPVRYYGNRYVNQNVYITSDDKFIRDEYVTDGIEVIKASPKLVDAQGLVGRRNWKKIILTTDIQLIDDGVQEIFEDFLKWFVDNPTCEFVKVEKECCGQCDERLCEIRDLQREETKYNTFYKIMITEEVVVGSWDANGKKPIYDYGYTTKMGVEVSDEMVRATMIPKDRFDDALDSFKTSLNKKYDDTVLTLQLTKEEARGLLTCIMRTSAKGKDLDVGEMVEEQLVKFLNI